MKYGKAVAVMSALVALSASAALAHADTIGMVTVNGTDSVYAVGTNAAAAGSYSATAPVGISIAAGATSFTFVSSTGQTVTVNIGSGSNYADADGIGSNSGETISGTANLSGITAPNAGFIAAVFLDSGGPGDTSTPGDLNFTGAGATAFSTLTPELNQVFFVGDGLTGDGSGSTQSFVIPTGATTLYLGLADACGFNGGPSCYGDNGGSFGVTYTEVGAAGSSPSAPVVPEPSSFALLGTGALGIFGVARRRFIRS